MVKQYLTDALDGIGMLRTQILATDSGNTELRATFRQIIHKLEKLRNQPMIPLGAYQKICAWLGQFLDAEHELQVKRLDNTEAHQNELESYIRERLQLLAMAEQTLPSMQSALHQCYALLDQTPKAEDIQDQARAFTQHLQNHLKDDARLHQNLNALTDTMKGTLEDITAMLFNLTDESPELSRTSELLQQALPDDPEAARTILQQAQEGILRAGKQISTAANTLRQTVEQQTKDMQELSDSLNRAKNQALHDPLTGLANRRKMDAYIEALPDMTVTFMMLDIDHFKHVNDRYGHDAGDEILSGLADILTDNVRSTDLVARMGGEEFAVILHDISGRQSFATADALRRAVEISKLKCHSGKVPVTVSMGVAVRRTGEKPDQWIKRADVALYEAKQSGRNCVKVSVL